MNYKKLSLDKLKETCNKREIPSEGRKDDLIKRLQEWDINKSNLFDVESQTKITLEKQRKVVKEKEETESTLYLQIKASNLPYYLNCGVIYPLGLEENEIYKRENRRWDILSQFPEHILLADRPIYLFNEEDVLVEIIINNLPLIPLKDKGLFYTENPIPVSRIKSVAFKTAKSKQSFIATVSAFPDSFFPENISCISPMEIDNLKLDLSSIALPANLKLEEWKVKLKQFDKILGMFAFMKNAGIFYADRDRLYQEYTLNYFGALSIINSVFKITDGKENGVYKYILFPLEIEALNIQRILFRQILDSINNEIEFDISLALKIINEALATDVATTEERHELSFFFKCFKSLENHQISYKDLLNDDRIKKNYPIMALLFLSKFSNKSRQHTDKQAVRNTFILHEANLNKNITEYLLGVLGLYYGYKTMIKQDTNLKLQDFAFNKLSEKQQSIKFKLNTVLDKVIIESIFNFCKIGETQNERFDFLWGTKDYKSEIKVDKDYRDVSYTVFETKITIVEKIDAIEEVIKLINQYYPEVVPNKSLLSHFLLSSYGIEKSALVNLVKINKRSINIEGLIELVELDIKQENKK